MRIVRIVIGMLFMVSTQSLSAVVINANPLDYISKVATLTPGDTLRLVQGTYVNNLSLVNVDGTAEAPIVIEGPAGDRSSRAVFLGSAYSNTVSIKNSKHVIIKNLYLDNNSHSGIDAVKAEATALWAHHITIEGCIIDGYGEGQQQVGISTKCPAWNWTIKNNRILGAGTGMYLGNSDGTREFVNGIIEGNYIEDTIGYNLQVKHQNTRTQLAEGMPINGNTIIRWNTFIKKVSRSGASARPNVLVGHFPPSGNGSGDHYHIYGNTFYENKDSERLFQGEGNVYFYNNRLVNTAGSAITLQAHKDKPKDVRVFYNTILCTGKGINISGVNTNYTQKVIGNLVFSTGISAADKSYNILDSYANAGNYLVQATASSLNAYNLVPLAGKATGSVIPTTYLDNAVSYRLDYNGDLRDAHYRGAYAAQNAGGSGSIDLAINFQPSMAPTVSGYEIDSGLIYAARGNGYVYGWSSANISTRDRNSAAASDQRRDTLIHFSKSADLGWRIELPNGSYDVSIVCGDPTYADQRHNLDIEGTIYTDPDGMDNYDSISLVVEVSDGVLNITPAAGSSNAKICYIRIESVVGVPVSN